MFRAFSKIPLRRTLHTQAQTAGRRTQLNRVALAGAASAAAATYLAWRASSPANHIALDSPSPTTPKKLKPEIQVDASPKVQIESDAQIPPASKHAETPSETGEKPDGEESKPAPADGEGEAASGGSAAYNPETGEINWDCPCLGGMAHGPCGENFREAFSCFVFSEEEPKGIDCVEKFKAMQDCFREHPDVYGEEIMDDDEDSVESEAMPATTPATVTGELGQSEFVDETVSTPLVETSDVPESTKVHTES